MACIYQIRNLVNGKFYIGSTCSAFIKRKRQHLSELRNGYHGNKYLLASWDKYGEENFSFEIIEEFIFPEEYNKDYIYEYVTLRELYYITSLNPQYNLARETSTGKLGRSPSKEEREHLRKLFAGRKVSEETKRKIKEARAKQIITEEHKRKIGLKSKGNTYCLGHKQSKEQKQKSRDQAFKCATQRIGMHSIESKEKRTNTLKVRFNTPEMKEKLKTSARNRNKRPFLCFKDKEFIGEFLSQSNTADKLSLKSSEICAVLRNEQHTTKGYTFIYKDIYNG